MGAVQGTVDAVLREAMLFAAIGLLIGGLDDLLVDLLFVVRKLWRRGEPPRTVATLRRAQAGRIVVFVPAWDEQAVIGPMLARALARYRHPDYRIHVGLYPNDPGTIAAVGAIAASDARVRPVIGTAPGPTTKAACLNTLWHDLVATGAVDTVRAIALHDAEDLVHPDELTVFDALVGDHAVVQLPVMPLVKPGSPFVSGHYLDEFAEAHGKQLPVRTFVGAGMPLAGTGCAVAPWIVARLAALRGGDPFDPASLVEDYELSRYADNSSYIENIISWTAAEKISLESAAASSTTRHKNSISRRRTGGVSSMQARSPSELLHRRT